MLIKFILSAILIFHAGSVMAQWRSLKISSGTDVNAIQENFRRASLWSNRKLDRFSNDTLYGQPIFQNGIKFGDGTIQNTAIPSTSSFLQSPATFYVVQTSEYLVAPASFTYARETHAHSYLTAPATFQILTPAQVIPSSATGYYGIRVATATYLATAPGACSAGDFISALSADGTKTCGTPSGSGDVVKSATQTFTGQNTFTGSVTVSSFTVLNGGITGVHNSSSTVIGSYSVTQNTFSSCVTGSTLTITTNGGRVMVGFSGNASQSANAQAMYATYKVDGVTTTSPIVKTAFTTAGYELNMSFLGITAPLSAGPHSFCLAIRNSGAASGTISGDSNNQFWITELR